MTNEAVAKVLGVHVNTIMDWKDTDFPLLSRVADVLGAHPIVLVKEDEDGSLIVDGDRVRGYATSCGTSLTGLAETLGVHRNTINNLVKHRFTRISRLAAALNVSPLSFLSIEQE